MSAFDARSATEVNIPQWSPVWVGDVFSEMIVRLNALYSPTRQIETLEGCRNRRARQIENARAEVNAKLFPTRQIETLEGCRNGRARQIENARAEVNAKRIRHKLSAQIPTKKGSKIEVKMTGRNARVHEVQNNKFLFQRIFTIKLDRLKTLEAQQVQSFEIRFKS